MGVIPGKLGITPMDKISLYRDNAHIDPNAQRNIGLEISFIGIFHATTKVAYTFLNLCGYTKSLKCLKLIYPAYFTNQILVRIKLSSFLERIS